MTEEKMSPCRAWFLAVRPKTLPASVTPVLVGTALAWSEGRARLSAALLCGLFAVLGQVAANLANDYGDGVRGLDGKGRLGPARAAALLSETLGVSINRYLAVPPEISQQLMDGRYAGDESKKDIHERDIAYLQASRRAAEYCAQRLGWDKIECAAEGKMRPIAQIHAEVLQKAAELLKG